MTNRQLLTEWIDAHEGALDVVQRAALVLFAEWLDRRPDEPSGQLCHDGHEPITYYSKECPLCGDEPAARCECGETHPLKQAKCRELMGEQCHAEKPACEPCVQGIPLVTISAPLSERYHQQGLSLVPCTAVNRDKPKAEPSIAALRMELAECRALLCDAIADPTQEDLKHAADWLANWDGKRIDVGAESERVALKPKASMPRMIWDPCSKGGLWKCDVCDEAYASPPWSRDKAAQDHQGKCKGAVNKFEDRNEVCSKHGTPLTPIDTGESVCERCEHENGGGKLWHTLICPLCKSKFWVTAPEKHSLCEHCNAVNRTSHDSR